MEVVYKSRPGAIRAMNVQSDAEHQLTLERQYRAQAEAELQEARQTIASLRTRIGHAEMALDECKAERAAERAKAVVSAPAPKKPRVARPQKEEEADPQPVRWWPKGSKWDLMED